MKKRLFLVFIMVLTLFTLNANTALKSYEEEYYDFLVLTGKTERSYLSYRTLSNNTYSNSNGIWDDCFLNRKRQISDDSSVTFYGPEFFASYNTKRPYGQNDGALWQGVGFNGQLKTGINYTFKGLSLTLKPEVDYSQNKEYTTIVTDYNESNPNNYFWGPYTPYDLPQRFGNDGFFTFDFGDSEIRYTKDAFTVGFGTQALWIGPTYLNSILHSNNAGTYPRFDIGVRKTPLFKFGNIELMYSLGLLTKSKYWQYGNEHTLLHLLSASYNPSFISGFTLGFNYVCHTEATWNGVGQLFSSFFCHDNGTEDAKASLSFDWIFPSVGFEVYGEYGVDDYTNKLTRLFHTSVGQLGLKKAFTLNEQNQLYGELFIELGFMEISRDAFTGEPYFNYNFYTHGKTPGSYTSKGQLIGAGTGWGGNSQYLGFNFIYPKGLTKVFVQRSNPDNNYIYYEVNQKEQESSDYKYFESFKAIFSLGVNSTYFVSDYLSLSAGAVFSRIRKDLYQADGIYDKTNSVHFELGGKYSF